MPGDAFYYDPTSPPPDPMGPVELGCKAVEKFFIEQGYNPWHRSDEDGKPYRRFLGVDTEIDVGQLVIAVLKAAKSAPPPELKALSDAAMQGTWHATDSTGSPEYPDDVWEKDPEETRPWTLSDDPRVAGWNTDSGYPGYGMSKADAEFAAAAVNYVRGLLAGHARAEGEGA